MTKPSHALPAVCLFATVWCAVPMPLTAADGAVSGGGSTCSVTVLTTNEDGSTDSSVRAFQAPCRSGQRNGDVEYYNPYTDSYETRHDLRIEPLATKKTSSGTSRSGAGTSQGGSTSGTTSGSSPRAGGSGAPCTTSGTASKAVKSTRNTSSGQRCTSTPR